MGRPVPGATHRRCTWGRRPLQDLLRCPHCFRGGSSQVPLRNQGATWGCRQAHSFDVARQGYVNLAGRASSHTGDTAEMLDARAWVLAAGHLDVVTDAVIAAAADLPAGGALVEIGAGNGHHLSRLRGVFEGGGKLSRPAVAIDASIAAARRAARTDGSGLVSVVADAWSPWPLLDDVAALVVSIFAPRNLPETARALLPGGRLIVVTPTEDHLKELRPVLGMLGTEPDKSARLALEVAGVLDPLDVRECRTVRRMSRADARATAAMGPSSFHLEAAELARRSADLPEAIDVTVAFRVSRFTTW